MRISLSKKTDYRRNRWFLLWFAVGTAAVGVVLIAGMFAGAILYSDGVTPGNLKQKIREYTLDQVRNVDAHVAAPSASKFQLDIGFEEFLKITAQRDRALAVGHNFSSDDDLVSATITFDGEEMDAEVRLKGDAVDHLVTDKWSFRVELQGDDRIWGTRRFSLQHPRTRHFHFEQAFLENLRHEGVLAPQYEFVDVTVNGNFLGVYAFEEFFGKELLESQGRRTGVIFGFDEQYYWEHANVAPAQLPGFELLGDNYLSSNAAINIFDQGRVSRDPDLSNQAAKAIEQIRLFQEGELDASDVFDVDRMATFLALSELWQVRHSLVANNLRFYYNPISGLIEPIGFDAQPEPVLVETITGFNNTPHQPLIGAILQHPVFAAAFVRELDRVLDPDYIVQINNAFGGKVSDSVLVLRREFPELNSPWGVFNDRHSWLRKVMNPSVAGIGYGRLEGDGEPLLRIEVANSLGVQVVVSKVELVEVDIESGQPITDSSVILDVSSAGELPTLPLRQILSDPLDFHRIAFPVSTETANQLEAGAELRVWGRIIGQDIERIIPIRFVDSLTTAASAPIPSSVDELKELWPFALVNEFDQMVRIPSGDHLVQGCVALPKHYDLVIDAGANLKFGSEGCLMVEGTIEINGTETEAVVLGPAQETWRGIYVQRAGGVSTWSHVSVQGTRGFDFDGRLITGGVTFNESPLVLRSVSFSDNRSEDALNVVGSSIDFQNVSFVGATSDGFDGDAVTGIIGNSVFLSIGGDGLDISGSNIEVSDLRFDEIADKALSVGEGSVLVGRNIQIGSTGIGIASKDLSSVVVDEISIEEFTQYAFAAYQKKPEYGAATIEVRGLSPSLDDESFLSHDVSRLIVDGRRVEKSDIDVGLLYDAGVLGN
jgi:hypothetical protein